MEIEVKLKTALQKKIEAGLLVLDISYTKEQLEKLLSYLFLLNKWNKAYNLTAVRDINEMVDKHILDSLAVLPYLQKEKINTLADVGTGAGLPGIPLAIFQPDWNLLLIDSNTKKTGFLQQVKTELKLKNVTIDPRRVEQCDQKVDAIISRAFSSLKEMLTGCEGLCKKQTVFWAMKGKIPTEELLEIPKSYSVSAPCKLAVPGVSGERCLLKIEKSDP